MTPEIMRQYLAAHAPELEVVELREAHTTEYISREWNVLPAQVAKTLTLVILWAPSRRSASVPHCPYSSTLG